jgi:hypothetical protein
MRSSQNLPTLFISAAGFLLSMWVVFVDYSSSTNLWFEIVFVLGPWLMVGAFSKSKWLHGSLGLLASDTTECGFAAE